MIFYKTAIQGNFIFSDGQPAVFQGGYYETEDEIQIEQLKKIYAVVESKPEIEKEIPAAQLAVKTGMASSASLAALTKANK